MSKNWEPRRLSYGQRATLIERQDGKCYYCRRLLNVGTDDGNRDMRRAVTDHKTPHSRGGKTNMRNCVAACRSCNSRKGAMTAKEFAAKAAAARWAK